MRLHRQLSALYRQIDRETKKIIYFFIFLILFTSANIIWYNFNVLRVEAIITLIIAIITTMLGV